MKKTTHDIYGTERKLAGIEEATERSGEARATPFAEALREHRRSTAVFVGVIVLFTALVGTIAVQQYLLYVRRPSVQKARAILPPEVSSSALGMMPNLQMELLRDELSEVGEVELPEGGDLPLLAQWVKQAAYNLVLAEKAERDQRFDDALHAYRKALLIFPRMQGVNRQLGLLYLRQKEYAKSAELFEKVIADEETTHGILNNLGVARLALGQQDQAEQTFRQAIQINPRYPLSYFNLATLYLRNEQTEKAAEYFEKYLEFKPGDLNTAQTYAMVLLKLERWAPASLLLDQISRQTPDVAPIHFRLAEALSHLQKPAEAMIALRRATQLVDPRQALAWMSRPEFDLLRGETAFRDLLTELGTAD